MIRVSNLRDMLPGHYDYCLAIMRSGNVVPSSIVLYKDLAPSVQLFMKYRELYKEGNWNLQTFKDIYVPEFMYEASMPLFRNALNKLWYYDKIGKTIQIGCCCNNENMCHRSVVGGILQGAGANVVYDSGCDYIHYSDLYKEFCL